MRTRHSSTVWTPHRLVSSRYMLHGCDSGIGACGLKLAVGGGCGFDCDASKGEVSGGEADEDGSGVLRARAMGDAPLTTPLPTRM